MTVKIFCWSRRVTALQPPPLVAPLLQGGVVELALPLQTFSQKPVLSSSGPQHLPIGNDHATKIGT